jgi:lysozyme
MTLDPLPLAFIIVARFESFRDKAYADKYGNCTIGFGHTGPDVTQDMVSTLEAETAWTKARLAWLWKRLDHDLGRDINMNQAAALLSLVYNVGFGALERSHMWQMLQDGQWGPAAEKFGDFCKAKTASGTLRADVGLIKRRKAERDLFLQPVETLA